MNITKSAPYYDSLLTGQQLQVAIISGSALVEVFINNEKKLTQAITNGTNFGPYLGNCDIKVTNISGLVDVVEAQPLIAYNPASINETGGTIINVAGGFTTLSASSTVSGTGFANYMASPPAIGATVPAAIKTSNLQLTFTDSTATPGNVTNNSPRGKVSFAAAATTIVISNSLVTANSSVLADMNVIDGALNGIVSCLAGTGTITITGNAAATTAGVARCDFIVIN